MPAPSAQPSALPNLPHHQELSMRFGLFFGHGSSPGGMPMRAAALIALGMATAAPATMVTTFVNGVGVPDRSGPDSFLLTRISRDGSPVTQSRFTDGGFAAAQATSDNNGTAIATVSGVANSFQRAMAESAAHTQFVAPPTTRGQLTLRFTGFAIASGSGVAFINVLIIQNGITIGDHLTYSTETDWFDTPNTGFQRLSVTSRINWRGGDRLSVHQYAFAQTPGVYNDESVIVGPGFASAYIDPTIDLSTVPEPASWALLITGFGLTGAIQRRRRAFSCT
jgi:hypothetical protein